MTQRYYFSRRPTQPEGGVYKIFDRTLDLRVASCDFKENAELLVTAANSVLRLEAENKLLRERPSMDSVVAKIRSLQNEIDRLQEALEQARTEARRNAEEVNRLRETDTVVR